MHCQQHQHTNNPAYDRQETYCTDVPPYMDALHLHQSETTEGAYQKEIPANGRAVGYQFPEKKLIAVAKLSRTLLTKPVNIPSIHMLCMLVSHQLASHAKAPVS